MKTTALTVVSALALTGVAGCTEQRESSAPAVATTSTPAPERLTLKVARQAFRAYTINNDVARACEDERLALSWAGDGQSQLIAAAFRKAAFNGDPVPRYDYRTPRFYVPRLTTYPQWFVVVADRMTKSGTGAPAGSPAGGQPDAAKAETKSKARAKPKHTAIMVLNRTDPSARWRLSLATILNDEARLPRIALDREGYATPLATFDTGLVIQPRGVPAIQATLAGEGTGSVAVSVMRTGTYTSGYYTQTRRAKKRAMDAGLAHDTVFTATGLPIFPLRTTDGGGLVLYALSKNTVTFLKNKGKGHLPIPRDAAHLLDTIVLKDEINVTAMMQFGAFVPANAPGKRPSPKAEVIAHDSAVTRAITSYSV